MNFLVLVDSLCPIQRDTLIAPSLKHCVGEGKLLGEHFGRAIAELFGFGHEDELANHLSKLGVLMRSFVVLDDYLKDSIVIGSNREYINKWIGNIELLIIQTLESIGGKGELWFKYKKKSDHAFYHFNKKKPYNSVIWKCGFIFLPLELPFINKRKERVEETKKLLSDFLFTLQLLDDFKDMEEDIISSVNHNLYLSNVRKSEAAHVVQKKHLLINPILKNIQVVLGNLTSSYRNSEIVLFHLEHANQWVRKKQKEYSDINSPLKITSPYREWEFSLKTAKLIEKTDTVYGIEAVNIQDISAEAIHTIKVL
jgi:hypothetical protein